MCFLRIGLSLLLFSTLAWGTPVIYKGGQMVDTLVDSKSTDIQWIYSHTSQAAVGYRYYKFISKNDPFHLVQSNWLIRRWNEEKSQGNIYAMTGGGFSGSALFPYLGVEADWESRVYYVAAQTDYFWLPDPFTRVTLRVGMAPYLTDFEGLHTWLILQATEFNGSGESTQMILPIIRLFKGSVLTEFGSNGTNHYASLRIHF